MTDLSFEAHNGLFGLCALNLWKQHLGSVPESVWERTELETLILADFRQARERITHRSSCRKFRQLAQLAGLPRLDKLDLRWVTTPAIPAWIQYLESRGCAVYR